jgi:hypothetical protein
VKYRGKLSEFLWLVPTPSKPVVKRFKNALFEELHEFTAPPLKYWFHADIEIRKYLNAMMPGMGSMPGGRGIGVGVKLSTVEVIKQERIGIYDTVILKATVAQDLQNWLNDNGYHISEKAIPVISDYLKRGWIFTAIRVNLQSAKTGWNGQQEGLLEPLSFTFNSPSPVYPLKISSLNAGSSEILLYVVAEKCVLSGILDTEVADHYYNLVPSAESVVDEDFMMGGAMTKLRGKLESKDMTQDLVFRYTDSRVPPVPVSPPFLENLGMLVLLTSVMIQTFPIAMIVPAVVALICLRKSSIEQCVRLLAIAFICVLSVYIFQRDPDNWRNVFDNGFPSIDTLSQIAIGSTQFTEHMMLQILHWLFIIAVPVLFTICIRVEKRLGYACMLAIGALYVSITAMISYQGINALQNQIATYAISAKSYSVYGLICIVLILLLGVLYIIGVWNKRKRYIQMKTLDSI